LATSGIDYDVKIWQPTLDDSVNLGDKLELVSENEFNLTIELYKNKKLASKDIKT
jgi:hypothetical protein